MAPATGPAGRPAPVPRTRLRDRVFGLRSLVAVAVAGVILGGLGGFGIHAATDGDDRDGRMGRFGPGGGFQDGPGGRGGPGGGFPARARAGQQGSRRPGAARTSRPQPPTRRPSQSS